MNGFGNPLNALTGFRQRDSKRPVVGRGICILTLHGRRSGVHGPLVDSGAVVLAVLQQIIPLDLRGIAGFAAEDRGKGRLRAVLAFVVNLAFHQGLDEIGLFLLVTTALALHLNGIALVRDDGRGQLADTLAAMRVFGDVTEGLVATQMTALAIHLVTAGVGVLHEGVVKDLRLAAVTAHALFTAAHAVGHDRVIVHDPVANIEVVDVLLADLVAAGPDEVVPGCTGTAYRSCPAHGCDTKCRDRSSKRASG